MEILGYSLVALLTLAVPVAFILKERSDPRNIPPTVDKIYYRRLGDGKSPFCDMQNRAKVKSVMNGYVLYIFYNDAIELKSEQVRPIRDFNQLYISLVD